MIRINNRNEFIKVENVYCVGKNYLEHIKEFDKDKVTTAPEEPIIFLKPNTAVVNNLSEISIPKFKDKFISENLQNEVELVIVIAKDGYEINLDNADEYIYGYCVGIDFTLRDIQSVLKNKGLPWALSKGFINSAPVSDIVLKSEVNDIENKEIFLKVNGEYKQKANTSEMLFKVKYLVYYLSHIYGLKRGDLIFTGTPAGVTKLNSGDVVEAGIENVGKLKIKVS
jgi:acylpyruvate hydrolase